LSIAALGAGAVSGCIKEKNEGNLNSEIGNSEVWDLEIGQTRYLKAEIRSLKLDLGDPGLRIPLALPLSHSSIAIALSDWIEGLF
jgi:hypothetical protein